MKFFFVDTKRNDLEIETAKLKTRNTELACQLLDVMHKNARLVAEASERHEQLVTEMDNLKGENIRLHLIIKSLSVEPKEAK